MVVDGPMYRYNPESVATRRPPLSEEHEAFLHDLQNTLPKGHRRKD